MLEPISKIMNETNGKILKEKMKDEEGGIISLRRLTCLPKPRRRQAKLHFLPKFYRLGIQVISFVFIITVYF